MAQQNVNSHFGMVLESLGALPPAKVPEGYRLRAWEDAMTADYALVINEAFGRTTHTYEGDVVKKEGYDRKQTWMIYCGEEPVAAATALADTATYGNRLGYLHMVGVRSGHKGKRLGEAICLACLHTMKGWGMDGCRLDTYDTLFPALVTYLRLGFRPLAIDEDYVARWGKTFETVGWKDETHRKRFHAERIPQRHGWAFQADYGNQGETLGFHAPQYNDEAWKRISAPLGFDGNVAGQEHYDGCAWYRRNIDGRKFFPSERAMLRFGGVNHHCKVWVNGTLVGEHRDGFLPFAFDITDYIDKAGDNTLAIWVSNLRTPHTVPSDHIGWRNHGGILRDVVLYAAPCVQITDCKFYARPSKDEGRMTNDETMCDGTLDYAIEIKNHGGAANIAWRMTVRDGTQTIAETTGEIADAGAAHTISGKLALPGIVPWTPDTPKLYDVTVTLEGGDTHAETLGVRSFTVKDGRMCLNGKPIKLFGFNLHEDSPGHDMCPNPASMEKDLRAMKAMGCNFVRLCHYPHDTSTYDLCDRLGLISWAEIPLYWFFVPKDNPAHAEMVAIAKRQIDAMVNALHNHASIAFWSVSNENTETMPEIAAANRELVRHAKARIPGGYAVHVCDRWPSEGAEPSYLTEDDVLCLNGYPAVPWNPHEPRRYNRDDAPAFWTQKLPELAAKYPNKPILISEFGYPALADTVDIDWSEATQAAALLHEAHILASLPAVSGLCVWCWADHQWPPSGFHGPLVSPLG
ncbi:MAG: hypothetical protein FWF84_04005, partial [Kiritimatiellaeota bacterium]|nr:hypothetical protein [Kiritimatiellota bacterium]